MVPLSMLESKSYFRHTITTSLEPEVVELVEAVTANVHGPGRLMIEDCAAMYYGDAHLPAMLPLKTGVEQIGGPYPHTYLLYYFTSFRWLRTFGRPADQWDYESLKPYLELYNVRWIVTASTRLTGFMSRLLDREPNWSRAPYALWTLRDAPPGDVMPRVRADINRIEISGDPHSDGYFIEYHWVPGLRASGSAKIKPIHRLGDPVPFVYVQPNGESEIVITY
jgi:hypothetical protein